MEDALIRQIDTADTHLNGNLLVDLWVHHALACRNGACVLMDSEALTATDTVER